MKIVLFIVILFSFCFSQSIEELKPWERLGITSKEYHECQLRSFPEDSIKYILKLGIMPSEYFQKPWQSLNIQLLEYFSYRKRGLSDDQIKTLLDTSDVRLFSSHDTSFDRVESKTGIYLKSLFLPGYMQRTCFKGSSCYDSQKSKSTKMIVLGSISCITTVAWSIKEKEFIPIPIFFILIPDMFWSYKNYKNHERSSIFK
jgi:hypothetical protein